MRNTQIPWSLCLPDLTFLCLPFLFIAPFCLSFCLISRDRCVWLFTLVIHLIFWWFSLSSTTSLSLNISQYSLVNFHYRIQNDVTSEFLSFKIRPKTQIHTTTIVVLNGYSSQFWKTLSEISMVKAREAQWHIEMSSASGSEGARFKHFFCISPPLGLLYLLATMAWLLLLQFFF